MKPQSLSMLYCVAPSPLDMRGSTPSADIGVCGGDLALRDELTLLCQRCGHEYPMRQGIPRILRADDTSASRYEGDTTIQAYYEMQYAPFLRGQDISKRLNLPALGARRANHRGVEMERFVDVQGRDGRSAKAFRPFYQSTQRLATISDITEPFYQFILSLCRPFVDENTVALDIGCALGRMSIELAQLGARLVVGVDRSTRMVEEATRLIKTASRTPIKLNLIPGWTIGASSEHSWTHTPCEFAITDALQLPFKEASFDFATCLNVVDRVRSPAQVVQECWRVLKPGGHLVIADPYDWDERFTPRTQWVLDLTDLFEETVWQCVREVDGVPFALRAKGLREITVYLSHCLVFRKVALDEGRTIAS